MALDFKTEAALINAVRRVAAAEIMRWFRNLSPEAIDTKSGPDDLVTASDRAAEWALANEVAGIMPDALFVGEESAHEDPGLLDKLSDAELAVIVDPIDGTGNYAAGIAVFGVILAVVEHGATVFGLLYDPVFDDFVYARKGGGAWFQGAGKPPQRLSGRKARPLSTSHGFVPFSLYAPSHRPEVAQAIMQVGRISSLRCSCHEYRQVALGQADFVVSPHAKPWDHAAGCLVVEEAGGRVFSAGREGYCPTRPAGPVVALADAGAPADLVPERLFRL